MAFASERTIKSVRRARRCCACATAIEVGSPAIDWSGTTDGDFQAVSYHVECRAAEIALNKLIGTQYDEWVGLDELEWEDWQFVLDEHPVVAVRLNITQAKIDETVAEMAACRDAFDAVRQQAAVSTDTQPGTKASLEAVVHPESSPTDQQGAETDV